MRPDPEPAGPGQESVWDYPRPAIAERSNLPVRIVFGGVTIAETDASVRVLETSHPPTHYIPETAFIDSALVRISGRSLCEWKGHAHYYDVVAGVRPAERAAWGYRAPTPAFAALTDHVAVYPAMVDACYLDGEAVVPQAGGFYGGWITSRVAGPFKGPAGTNFW
ncbi:MAG: DUF427 domain-containing protein [Pseudomonadota bacterium]